MRGDGEDEAEALRRRLYRPGATEEDLAQYRGAAPGAAAERTIRRRPRPRTVGLLAAAAVLLAAVLVAVLLRPAAAPSLPAPAAVALTAEDRAELLGNLARGGDAGIAAYLVTHPSPPGLRGRTGFTTVEDNGTGSRSVRLVPEGVGGDAGQATVLLVLGGSGRASWSLERLGTEGSPVVRLHRVAARGGDQAAGALTSATVAYASGRRPVLLRVTVDDDVRWGAAVVYSR